MAPPWQVVLNNGEYTFEVPTRFSIRKRKQMKQNGTIDFFETVIAVEGILRGQGANPADDVTTRFQALLAMMDKPAPLKVELKLNGTTRYTFSPANSIGSPTIREIVEIPAGASHATHVRFEANIYVRTLIDIGIPEIEFSAVYFNNLLQRAEWKVTVVGLSMGQAKNKAKSFKPANLKPLMEVYRENTRNNEFEATWTYDREKGGGLLNVIERIEVVPNGSPVRPDPRVGDAARVVFFRGRNMPAEVTIEVTMEASDIGLLVEPKPHYKEGQFKKRDRRKERGNLPAIFDSRKGLWRAVFYEFWYIDGSDFAADISHSDDHDKAFPDKKVTPPQGGVPVP